MVISSGNSHPSIVVRTTHPDRWKGQLRSCDAIIMSSLFFFVTLMRYFISLLLCACVVAVDPGLLSNVQLEVNSAAVGSTVVMNPGMCAIIMGCMSSSLGSSHLGVYTNCNTKLTISKNITISAYGATLNCSGSSVNPSVVVFSGTCAGMSLLDDRM